MWIYNSTSYLKIWILKFRHLQRHKKNCNFNINELTLILTWRIWLMRNNWAPMTLLTHKDSDIYNVNRIFIIHVLTSRATVSSGTRRCKQGSSQGLLMFLASWVVFRLKWSLSDIIPVPDLFAIFYKFCEFLLSRCCFIFWPISSEITVRERLVWANIHIVAPYYICCSFARC